MGIVLAYWFEPPGLNVYRGFFSLTVTIFLFEMLNVVVYHVEDHNNRVRVKDAELSAFKAISTVDQLTGLKNRRAFDEKINEIANSVDPKKDAALVFMDLNCLKYANDTYGHMMGDDLIISAAKSIQIGFEPDGYTYRIGGDEFAVIIEGTVYNINKYYEKMDEAIDKYNETAGVHLSIARGYSRLLNEMGQRILISDWKLQADKKMYEDKVLNSKMHSSGSAEAYLEIISSFVGAVDAKDSYTANHSNRVGQLSLKICELLGLSSTTTDEIHVAACLHDIGKIGIPYNILTKKEGLTEEEWNVMKSHTIVGEEIVKHTKAFYDVSQMIRHHHERIDGTGYPDGIKGDEIPLGARIISIADSIDAMTSSRAYRNARSFEFCKEEIRKNLGTMYDQTIGSIILDNWSQIEDIIIANPPKEIIEIEYN